MSSTLIFVLVMVLSSAGKGIYEAYQKKKAAMELERLEQERNNTILRTGRDPKAEAAEAELRAQQNAAAREQARQRAAIEERQEALRQLRSGQAQANQPPQMPQPRASSGGGGGPITRELWPGGPVIVINGSAPAPAPAPAAPRPQQPAPQRQQMPAQRQPMPQRTPDPRRQPQPVSQPRQQKSRPQQQQQQQPAKQAKKAYARTEPESRHDADYYMRERTSARMSIGNEATAAAAEPAYTIPSTPQQWRAAFIASEIFGTPVSLRTHNGLGH